MTTVDPVTCSELPRQAFVDRPRTEHQQGVVRGQTIRDVGDESVQVFDPVRFACRLRAAAAVTDARIVPHVAG